MKTIITGASGFLGQKLLDLLRQQGHEIFILGQRQPKETLHPFIKADIRNLEELKGAREKIGQADSLIHLAALVPKNSSEDKASTMLDINAGGTINLLEVFGGRLKNFVYASTAEVYGLPVSGSKIRETTTPAPLSYYGASKLAGELFANAYGKKNQLPVSSLRFSVMYGPGDTINRAVPNFIKRALAGEQLEVFGGEELRDYINVADAAQALVLAAAIPSEGIYNIGTGEGISIKQTAEIIVSKIDPNLSIKVLPRQKVASDVVLDISRAQDELGFKPRYKFPDQLEEQITWQKSQL
jgi:nucleoside-diphosphate-sugar epimerase